jgi:transposase
MRFAGIDIAAERHVAAMVDETGRVLFKPSAFGEDAEGYTHLFQLLGAPEDCLVALEATGHYWRNLFVSLVAKGYAVAVLNPLRTRRFAEEEPNGPRLTRLMLWGSRGSPHKNGRPQPCCRSRPPKSCESW